MGEALVAYFVGYNNDFWVYMSIIYNTGDRVNLLWKQ